MTCVTPLRGHLQAVQFTVESWPENIDIHDGGSRSGDVFYINTERLLRVSVRTFSLFLITGIHLHHSVFMCKSVSESLKMLSNMEPEDRN